MARNRCGTIREIPHRDGWWCVFRKGIGRKPDGSRKYQFFTRFAGRTRKAGEKLSAEEISEALHLLAANRKQASGGAKRGRKPKGEPLPTNLGDLFT